MRGGHGWRSPPQGRCFGLEKNTWASMPREESRNGTVPRTRDHPCRGVGIGGQSRKDFPQRGSLFPTGLDPSTRNTNDFKGLRLRGTWHVACLSGRAVGMGKGSECACSRVGGGSRICQCSRATGVPALCGPASSCPCPRDRALDAVASLVRDLAQRCHRVGMGAAGDTLDFFEQPKIAGGALDQEAPRAACQESSRSAAFRGT